MDLSTFGDGLFAWIGLNWVLLLLVGIIAAAFIFLRSSPSRVNSMPQLNGLLTQGQPTVIEFYSNF